MGAANLANTAPVIRVVSLDHLLKQFMAATSAMGGRTPTRIVASPIQVDRWAFEAVPRSQWMPHGGVMTIMGARLVKGAHDAQPEFIWSRPIEADF
jgi:hypothetical protein